MRWRWNSPVDRVVKIQCPLSSEKFLLGVIWMLGYLSKVFQALPDGCDHWKLFSISVNPGIQLCEYLVQIGWEITSNPTFKGPPIYRRNFKKKEKKNCWDETSIFKKKNAQEKNKIKQDQRIKDLSGTTGIITKTKLPPWNSCVTAVKSPSEIYRWKQRP